jgi:hypothetical protein
MEKNKIFYFGYATTRELEMMKAITGKENLFGQQATLKGYSLYVQRLDQIPNKVIPNSPEPISAQRILQNNWGESFISYVIKSDENGQVRGVVWELDELDYKLLKNWELNDYGWFKDLETNVILENGETISIITGELGDGQEIDHEVEGDDYPSYLIEPERLLQRAKEVREQYLEDLRTKEGGKTASEK